MTLTNCGNPGEAGRAMCLGNCTLHEPTATTDTRPSIAALTALREGWPAELTPGIRHCIIETDGGHYPPGAIVAAAIARTRNNLAAMANQLEAARAEIERLREAMAAS